MTWIKTTNEDKTLKCPECVNPFTSVLTNQETNDEVFLCESEIRDNTHINGAYTMKIFEKRLALSPLQWTSTVTYTLVADKDIPKTEEPRITHLNCPKCEGKVSRQKDIVIKDYDAYFCENSLCSIGDILIEELHT